jgi:hypothetical protein
LCVLGIVSAWVVPDWPIQMLRAPRQSPLPTDYFPWYGTTWLLVLKTVGLHSWPLWIAYAALAVPFLLAVCKTAVDREGTLPDLFALGALATFFIAPYGQPYDFLILVIPFLVLMGGRLKDGPAALLLVLMIVLPYVHIHYIKSLSLWWIPAKPAHQVTFFWIPLLLAGVWVASSSRWKARRSLPEAIPGPGPRSRLQASEPVLSV